MSYFALQQDQYEQDALYAERDLDINGIDGDNDNDNVNAHDNASSVFSALKLRRLKLKIKHALSSIASLPQNIRLIVRQIMIMLRDPSQFYQFVMEVWDRLKNTPMFVFYSYLWKNRKMHFFMNVFVSYLLPMILEALPWYFSRRKLGQKLRSDRNTIQNRMIAGKQLTASLAQNYVIYTVLYSLLENLERHLNNRVTLVNRLVVKRLVLEKILYSEVWAFGEYQGRELEYRISNEIHMTLRLFSTIIPKLFSSFYAIYQESRDLYANRAQIDLLSVGLPMCSMVVWKCVDWTKTQIMGRRKLTTVVSTPKVSELFTNVMDGLTDIQLNNLQGMELRYYDEIIEKEFNGWEDFRMFGNRVYNTFTRRGVFDFLSEVYVAALVMKKKSMDFEQYRKVQIDIDHLVKLMRRTGNYLMQTKRTVERQNRVVELMRLPNFMEEKMKLTTAVNDFERLEIEDITFSYSRRSTGLLALNFTGQIVFEADKVYAIIGENRSGKSTLVNLLTKLYVPNSGTIAFNGIDYSLIERESLRNLISYVAQKPYIFPGTVMENIRVGNPSATDNDVIRAARLAGLFLYDEKLSTERRKKSKLAVEPQPTAIVVEASDNEKSQVSNQETEVAEPTLHADNFDSVEEEDLDQQEPIEHATTANAPEENNAQECKPQQAQDSVESSATGTANKKKISRKRALKILNQPTQARGANISGGFAQSIALARVFLRKEARIVVLDESMSAMDPIKKRRSIMPNLMQFIKENKMTLLLISHDMSCIPYVDHIVMLETGRLVCQGSHDQLTLQNEQKYLQMLGMNPSL